MMSTEVDERNIVKKVHRLVNGILKEVQLFPEDATILVACSGGPDSMVLVEILQALAVHRKTNWRIGIATMNHGIRPESAEEVRMVQDYCDKRFLPFWTISRDIPRIAKERGQSLETVGRDERYQWLLDVAQTEGFQYIAVAHHKDDQAETILAHFIRGSGLRGLTGMDIVRHDFHTPLVRPLLTLTKADILAYAAVQGISYCLDSSNDDVVYTRNFIRHRIMPALEQLNPNIGDVLCRLGAIAKEDADYIDSESRIVFDALVSKEAGRFSLSRRALRKQPLAIQRRIWQRVCKPLTLSWAHQEQLRQITFTGEPKSLHISHITIEAQCDTIQVYCQD